MSETPKTAKTAEQLCKIPTFRPNFADVEEVDVEQGQEITCKCLHPSTNTRFEVTLLAPVNSGELITRCKESLGRGVTSVSIKVGPPKAGPFAMTHPGWDDRMRVTGKPESGSLSARPYREVSTGRILLDVVV
ncbi:unnamed protein product, partial [Chrysoparadoxa australica]